MAVGLCGDDESNSYRFRQTSTLARSLGERVRNGREHNQTLRAANRKQLLTARTLVGKSNALEWGIARGVSRVCRRLLFDSYLGKLSPAGGTAWEHGRRQGCQ
jgi:hypothetical protein